MIYRGPWCLGPPFPISGIICAIEAVHRQVLWPWLELSLQSAGSKQISTGIRPDGGGGIPQTELHEFLLQRGHGFNPTLPTFS